jgi:hypothetical protein
VRTQGAPTYLVPADDVASASPWTDQDGRELPETLDHWDPFTELVLSRALTVDLDKLREQCRVGTDSAFAVIASWRSPNRTRLGGAGERVDLGALDGLVRASVSLIVPGPESGGRLDLTTRLVLRTPGSGPSPISPKRPGAVLWTETERVALEGGSARFPMTAVDFASLARVPDDAAWYVDWDQEDLEAPVLGGLRLLLNSRQPRIISAVRTATDDPAATIVRSLILCDVARHLVRSGLDNETFVDAPDIFAEESVGRLLSDLIATVWPGMPVVSLRARAIHEPARLDAEIQAVLGLAE